MRPETAEELAVAIKAAAARKVERRDKKVRGWTASTEPKEPERTRWTDTDLDDIFLLIEGIGLVLAQLSTRITKLEGKA